MLGEILENPLIFRTASALVEWQRNCPSLAQRRTRWYL